MREKRTSVLVIGSGIAGLSAAIELADQGKDVLVISAAPELHECNTAYAQGGIIYQALKGDPHSLENDIMEAGSGTNYRPAVRQLATLGPSCVQEILLEKAQVPFDPERDKFHLTLEGGHSEPRILHRGDESGRTIQEGLYQYCKSKSTVEFQTRTTTVNLLMSSHHGLDRSRIHEPARCFGAFVFDQVSGEVYPIFADHTVLATGGSGQLFLHNTNSKFARGDGLALADRAGCRLENLEYVQFHPTTFFKPKSPRFLVSEALRGEGAVLLNEGGERFLTKYISGYSTPELAPRDKVARAIHLEMLASGSESVYLDISHRPADWIRERFPFVYKSCLKYGVDITQSPIPVVPGAHYQCGGVWTDLQGRTSVRNLWAAGEVACTGVHGANRLASTSLLEGLVWGKLAGAAISGLLEAEPRAQVPEIEPWSSENAQVEPSFLTQDWLTLKHTMWNYVGLIKTDARLSRAEGILIELARGIDVFYRKAKLSDSLIGLRHASLVALRVLEACKANPRSQGCYQREDWEI
jgi:L-aspartate oxidase